MNWLVWFDRLPLRRKGLLILIPFLVQLAFLLALWGLLWNFSSSQQLVLRSKDILTGAETTYGSLTRWHNAIVSYVMSRSDVSRDRVLEFGQRSEAGFTSISRLLDQDEYRFSSVKELNQRFSKLKSLVAHVLELVEKGQSAEAVAIVQRFEVGDEIGKIRDELDKFITEQGLVDNERLSRFHSAQRRMTAFIVFGSAIALISLLLAGWAFMISVGRRLSIISSKVELIKTGGDLPPPDSGRDELAMLDHTLHNLNRALYEKNLEIELFVYSVSHDLRSPLLNLEGFREELVNNMAELRGLVSNSPLTDEDAGRIREICGNNIEPALRFIASAIGRISGIIEALLKLSRAGRIEYSWKRVPLTPLAQKVAESLHGSLTAKKAQLSIRQLPTVYGDPTAFEQVIGNLITNAIQYLDAGRPGIIEVFDASGENSEPGTATIAVQDNGVGIPDDAQKKLFLAFQRFHPAHGNGEGIGLALTRRMMERLGGRIWVKSSPSGSCFYVSFLTSKPAAAGGMPMFDSSIDLNPEGHSIETLVPGKNPQT